MKILFNSTSVDKFRTGLFVFPVASAPKEKRAQKKKKTEGAWRAYDVSTRNILTETDRLSGGFLRLQLKSSQFVPVANKRFEVANPQADARVKNFRLSAVSSLTSLTAHNLEEWRKLGGDAARSAKRLKTGELSIYVSHLEKKSLEHILPAIVEGAILANHEFKKFKGKQPSNSSETTPPSINLTFVHEGRLGEAVKTVLAQSVLFAEQVCFARDLVNTPPSDLLPSTFVKHAREAAKGSPGIKLKVYDKRALGKMKAFALLGVSRGSSSEPYLIHLSYTPRKKAKGSKVVTLVGKGITFDSGGLSLKTGKGMEDMKCDMAGAACVLSVFRAIKKLPKKAALKHEVHVLIPTCENMVSADSIKPGDVLRSLNGKTIEVLNTDAEGRLILADALSYAERLKSDFIIDLATLTGACIVALGSDYAGLFASDQDFGKSIQEAFAASGEKLWPLPLASEYRGEMESTVADLRNIGTGGPGAILGALFLQEFVPKNVPWAHLDIAGPAFVSKQNEYIQRGGTGFGVLSLLHFLQKL